MRRLEDLCRRAEKTGLAASRFLTPAEAEAARARFERRGGVSFALYGGIEGAERRLAVFSDGEPELSGLVSAVRLDYRGEDSPGHRDVLGALMALGVEREVLGDILCGGGPPAYVLCLAGMAEYIAGSLTQVGWIGVRARLAELGELPEKRQEYRVVRDTLASLRLDAVLASAFGLSRGEASRLIASGRAALSHTVCENPARHVSEGDTVSVRGLGKARLAAVGGVSKKGRIWIELWKYV